MGKSTGLIRPRIGTGVGHLWKWLCSGFHKIWGIFWLAENLLVSQEGLCSVELLFWTKFVDHVFWTKLRGQYCHRSSFTGQRNLQVLVSRCFNVVNQGVMVSQLSDLRKDLWICLALNPFSQKMTLGNNPSQRVCNSHFIMFCLLMEAVCMAM